MEAGQPGGGGCLKECLEGNTARDGGLAVVGGPARLAARRVDQGGSLVDGGDGLVDGGDGLVGGHGRDGRGAQ